jgi:DNA-binding transcriptional ArsR family regulator
MDKIFKALADVNRRRILTLLKDGELSVNQIVAHVDIGQATVSNHLSILKKADLVLVRNQNKSRIYSINWPIFRMFVTQIQEFSGMKAFEQNEIIMRRK